MEQNGQADPSSMVLDSLSPTNSNNSRDTLDEPAVPRRNSTDDNDPSRPRKRPAVMATGQEDQRESLANRSDPESPGETGKEMETGMEGIVRPESGAESDASKTIELRAAPLPESTPTPMVSRAESLDETDETGNHSPSYSPDHQTELRASVGSESQSPVPRSSPDIEIEEIAEADTGDDEYSHYIHVLGQNSATAKPVARVSNIDDPRSFMESIAHSLEKDECPVQPLEQIGEAISMLVSVGDDANEFRRKFLQSEPLWCLLPEVTELLLKRTDKFSNNFYETNGRGIDGVALIAKLLCNFIRVTALLVQSDTIQLQRPPSYSGQQELALHSTSFVRTVHGMILQLAPLYEVIEVSGHPISRSVPDIVLSFVGNWGLLKALKQFLRVVFEKVPSRPMLLAIVPNSIAVASALMRSVEGGIMNEQQDESCKAEMATTVGDLFIFLESALGDLLKSHIQRLDVKDFVHCVDHLSELARDLHSIFYGVPNTLDARLKEKAGASYRLMAPAEVPTIAELSCRLPFYHKMLASNRMDFRLRGLSKIAECLVRVWKSYMYDDWEGQAIFRYLVDYLLLNKVVEYLVGPESHHELIRRSGSIVSFLIITHAIVTDIFDAIWQPVVDNKDPRIVDATLFMHQDMFPNMDLSMLVELTTRVSSLPLSALDTMKVEFISLLLGNIRNKLAATPRQSKAELYQLDPAPYEMLIKLIKMASECEEGGASSSPSSSVAAVAMPTSCSYVLEAAARELMGLVESGPANGFRRQVFLECVEDFRSRQGSPSVQGSAIVMHAFLMCRPRVGRTRTSTEAADDVKFLIEVSDFPKLMIDELTAFVTSHKHCDDEQLRQRRLKCRLEVIQDILQISPDCLSDELHSQLWSTIVGERALGEIERDQGLEFYLSFDKVSMNDHPLLDKAYKLYFPALDSAHFSPMILEFCKRSLRYLNKQRKTCSADPDVPIAGIEELWRILLSAGEDRLANDAANLLVSLLLDSSEVNRLPAETAEKIHIRTVQRGISQLTSSSGTLFSSSTAIRRAEEEGRNILVSGSLEESLRLCYKQYHRSLDLLDQLVKEHKTRPQFNRDRTPSPGTLNPKGEKLTLRLRWHADKYQSPVHNINVGASNTGTELHNCISVVVGGSKHRDILSGKELKLLEEPLRTLKDFGITDGCFLQVQKAPTDCTTASTAAHHHVAAHAARSSDRCGLQPVIMDQFESLYALLALPETLSAKAWQFLRNFPPHPRIMADLAAFNAPFAALFPTDKPYQMLYTLYALSGCFERMFKVEETAKASFTRASVSRLLEALMSNTIDAQAQSVELRIFVTAKLMECLRFFLQGNKWKPQLDPYKKTEEESVITDFADVAQYIQCLERILLRCTEEDYTSRPGVDECIANTIDVLFMSCKISPRVWSQASTSLELHARIRETLSANERPHVRRRIGDAIIAMCTSYSSSNTPPNTARAFTEFFWSELAQVISDTGSLDPERSDGLFYTAQAVFQSICRVNREAVDLQGLFSGWLSRLGQHQFTESVGKPTEDHVILGYTRLLRRCVQCAQAFGIVLEVASDDVDHLWRHLLFPHFSSQRSLSLTQTTSHPIERIPCLNDDTRSELYSFLLDLANDNKHCARLVRHNLRLFTKDYTLLDTYHLDRRRWLRAEVGYVGMHNLSNTCYLNSLLTQLFMNLSFRSFILNLPLMTDDDIPHQSDKATYHLQALFARMQNGFCKAVEPREFVESLQDFSGQPIDPTVQMDVDEFYNLVFDRLESEMPSETLKSSFRSYYGGQLVQQVKSHECGHISERTEPFSAIQCDIKGKSNLQESLKAYVEGELMEGDNKYRCNTCDRLVTAVKRTCLKDVPENLILHLKRFDFDLSTLHRSKINDYFNFPATLDIRPYMMDYLSAKENGHEEVPSAPEMYELVGVLVHTGTAESGHYYSYIRDRSKNPAAEPSWIEYNDSDVSAFDPQSIPGNCFGGCDAVNTHGYPKAFSAYMLFYQRSSSFAAEASSTSLPPTPPASAVMTRRASSSYIPWQLRWEVLEENEQLLRRYCMVADNYVAFVKGLLNKQIELYNNDNRQHTGFDDLEKALSLGLKTFEQIASRYRDCTELDGLMAILEQYIISKTSNDSCTRFFLEWASREETIRSVILYNPYPRVRQWFARILPKALEKNLRAVIATTDSNTELNLNNVSIFPSGQPQQDCLVFDICAGFAASWNGLQWSLKPWNDFFGILVDIAKMGFAEREMMLQTGILMKLFETLLIDYLPPSRRNELGLENVPKMWNKPKVPAGKFAELLALLLEICSPFLEPCKDNSERQGRRCETWLPFTSLENSFFRYNPEKLGLAVFTKLLELNPSMVDAVEKITVNILTAAVTPLEHPFLNELKETLLSGVSVEPAVHAWPYLRCLVAFISKTRSRKYVTSIVKKVAEEVPTIGSSGGMEHFLFFRSLFDEKDGDVADVPDGKATRDLLRTVRLWAPPLLVYCDAAVRDKTEDLLEELMIEPFERSFSDDMCNALLELSEGCFDFVLSKLPRDRRLFDEKTFESLMRVLQRTANVHADREQFDLRVNDLMAVIRSIVEEEDDEDADLASDDWDCSEFSSPTRELPMQLDE